MLTTVHAQSDEAGITFGGTHPPDPGVLALLEAYSAASEKISDGVMARSEEMRPLQSEGYMYHGWDGAPIGKAGLNDRQTANGLRIDNTEIFDGHLYQYENTAIATYAVRQSGEDRGKPFKDLLGSGLIIMGKENGEWKVLSDVVGQEPSSQGD
ncbi:MAG: hypothetical protein V2I43_12710 [Parvularcula sp.]|nr:hypothetical protein [Parvularcula sp.]